MSGGMKPNKKNKVTPRGSVSMRSRVLIGLTLAFGILALGILVFSYLPAARIKKDIPLSLKSLTSIGVVGYSAGQPPIIHIDYPANIFAGDGASAKMILEPAGIKSGNAFPLVADFLMELDGANIGPDGDILIPIANPYAAEARWNVAPFRGGDLNGKAWLHLQTVDTGGETKKYLIMAYPVEIQSIVLLGGSIVIVRLVCIFIFFSVFVVLLIFAIRNWPQKQPSEIIKTK